MDLPRIIFVPGMRPKPPPEIHKQELLSCLAAGLDRVSPAAADGLREHPERLTLVPWTFRFYGSHRDIQSDRPGIDRIIAHPEPTADDIKEIDTLARGFSRWLHVLGDAVPLLGRVIARPEMRNNMAEAHCYLRNRGGIAIEIRAMLKEPLREAWRAGERVALIGHSMGSVIAYDTLWELSHGQQDSGPVEIFISMGSPLATRFMRGNLQGANRSGRERYPTIVRRWENFSAKGDGTAIHPELRPIFSDMVDLGLVESITDHTDFYNPYRGAFGLNAHMSYGYLLQTVLATVIAESFHME